MTRILHEIIAKVLADLRDFMPKIKNAGARLRVIDLTLKVEALNFKTSTELRKDMDKLSRRERIKLLQHIALAAYAHSGNPNSSLNAEISSA